jgi:hypothetical protein
MVDTTAPTITLNASTFQSTEIGTGYLVKSSILPTTVLDITSAADAEWNSVNVLAANTSYLLDTTGLNEGSYKLYATDAAGNLSSASSNTYTIDTSTPVISSASSASWAENATGTVYTATASDTFTGGTMSYVLGGVDAARFNINATSGAVTFAATPNYESPLDNGGNNIYDFTMTASDGTNTSAAQAVQITVTNVAELGDSIISLGAGMGQLINPILVDNGISYYYWDKDSNGAANTADIVTHDYLDTIFTHDVSGISNPGFNTTDAYRYATLNGVNVALPTVGFTPLSANGFQNGTSVGNATPGTGSNSLNSTFDAYAAIWDAYNGTSTNFNISGVPSGWAGVAAPASTPYWTASEGTINPHHVWYFNGNNQDSFADTTSQYVAMRVIFA